MTDLSSQGGLESELTRWRLVAVLFGIPVTSFVATLQPIFFVPIVGLTIILSVGRGTALSLGYLLLLFILYDWATVWLLKAGFQAFSQAFQGILLGIILAYWLSARLFAFSKVRNLLVWLILLSAVGVARGAPIAAVLAFWRNIVVLPTLLLWMSKTVKGSRWALGLVVFLIAGVSVVLDVYQNSVGLHDYIVSTGIDLFFADRGISQPGDMPTGFFTRNILTGEPTWRMLGVFVSPDKNGYLFAVPIVVSATILGRKSANRIVRLSLYLAAIVGVFLFHVKAVVAFSVIWFLFEWTGTHKLLGSYRFKIYFYMISAIIISEVLLLTVSSAVLGVGGAIQHLWGLSEPIFQPNSYVTWLMGNGIGKGGTLGGAHAANAAVSKTAAGGESFIGNVFYSVGLVGFVAYMQFIAFFSRYLARTSRAPRSCSSANVLVAAVLASAYSEPVLSFFQSIALASIAYLTSRKQRPGAYHRKPLKGPKTY